MRHRTSGPCSYLLTLNGAVESFNFGMDAQIIQGKMHGCCIISKIIISASLLELRKNPQNFSKMQNHTDNSAAREALAALFGILPRSCGDPPIEDLVSAIQKPPLGAVSCSVNLSRQKHFAESLWGAALWPRPSERAAVCFKMTDLVKEQQTLRIARGVLLLICYNDVPSLPTSSPLPQAQYSHCLWVNDHCLVARFVAHFPLWVSRHPFRLKKTLSVKRVEVLFHTVYSLIRKMSVVSLFHSVRRNLSLKILLKTMICFVYVLFINYYYSH